MFSLSDILHPLNVIGRKPITGYITILRYSQQTEHSIQLDCSGQITIRSIYNGHPVVATYSDLSMEYVDVSADLNTDITIIGNLTGLAANDYYDDLVYYWSDNAALTWLNVDHCFRLSSLDISRNTALTFLSCDGCYGLTEIKYPATNSSVSTSIANAITNAAAADGTVYTDSAADYYSTIATAANNKGWTIAQL